MGDFALNFAIDFDALQKLADNLNLAPKILKSAINSSMASAGYFLWHRITVAIASNEFGWKQLAKHPKYGRSLTSIFNNNPPRSSRVGKGIRVSRKGPARAITGLKGKDTTFWGTLGNAIRYSVNKEKMSTVIGVLELAGTKGAMIAEQIQKPHTVNLSVPGEYFGKTQRNMNNYFRALEIPLSANNSSFMSPGRELFNNVYAKYSPTVNTLINAVIADKLTNGFEHKDFTPFDFQTGAV